MDSPNLQSAASLDDALLRWSRGDQTGLDEAVSPLYAELQRLIRSALRKESQANTLDTSGLIAEVYLRLRAMKEISIESRGHFFGLAASVLRKVLVDHARRRNAMKRGGAAFRTTVSDLRERAPRMEVEVLIIDQLLTRLEGTDPRVVRMLELRFFAGFEEEEIAETLGVSRSTVQRDWRFARRWLAKELPKTVDE